MSQTAPYVYDTFITLQVRNWFDLIFPCLGDSTLPEVTCPADIVLTVAPGVSEAAVSWDAATASCASDTSGIASLVSTLASPADITANAPPTVVTYTATDNFGNMASCSFTIEVLSGINILHEIHWA